MATAAELEQKLSGLELNADRIRTRTEALRAEYEDLKNRALSTNFNLPADYAGFLAARAKATEARQELETSEADLSTIELEISNIKTEINAVKDQGPKTNSAGLTQQEADQARDDKATSQSPPADGQTVDADGNVSTTTPTTVATNAESSGPQEPEVSPAPPKLPDGANADAAAEDPAAAQGTSPTPTASSVLQVFEKQSDARYSYIYRAKEVISIFNQGKFTQEITGSLIPFNTIIKAAQPAPSGSKDDNASAQNTVDYRTAPDQSDAETRRLSAAADSARRRGGSFAQRQADAAITLREARAGRAFTTNPGTETRNFERIYGLQPSSSGPIAPADSAPATSNGQPVAAKTAQDDAAYNPKRSQLIKKD